MSSEDIISAARKKMEKAAGVLEDELRGIRTGRASPALVEHITVSYYGTGTPLKQLASIAVPEPQAIIIKPYDPSVIKEIEKAILQSDLGLSPQNDGKCVRINVPPLSEERRKKLASQAKELAEAAKVSIRNIRREANKHADKEEKDSVLTEDEARKTRERVQDLTRDYEKKINQTLDKKTEEIMKF